jgi:hypothetical protein
VEQGTREGHRGQAPVCESDVDASHANCTQGAFNVQWCLGGALRPRLCGRAAGASQGTLRGPRMPSIRPRSINQSTPAAVHARPTSRSRGEAARAPPPPPSSLPPRLKGCAPRAAPLPRAWRFRARCLTSSSPLSLCARQRSAARLPGGAKDGCRSHPTRAHARCLRSRAPSGRCTAQKRAAPSLGRPNTGCFAQPAAAHSRDLTLTLPAGACARQKRATRSSAPPNAGCRPHPSGCCPDRAPRVS